MRGHSMTAFFRASTRLPSGATVVDRFVPSPTTCRSSRLWSWRAAALCVDASSARAGPRRLRQASKELGYHRPAPARVRASTAPPDVLYRNSGQPRTGQPSPIRARIPRCRRFDASYPVTSNAPDCVSDSCAGLSDDLATSPVASLLPPWHRRSISLHPQRGSPGPHGS